MSLFACLSSCLCLPVCLSLFTYLNVSVYLSACLCLPVCLCLHVCRSLFDCHNVSVCLSAGLCLPACMPAWLHISVCLFAWLCWVCLSIRISLPACLSACLSVCLSLRLLYVPPLAFIVLTNIISRCLSVSVVGSGSWQLFKLCRSLVNSAFHLFDTGDFTVYENPSDHFEVTVSRIHSFYYLFFAFL